MTGVDRMGGGGAADVNAAQATLRFFGSGTVIAIDGADGSEATATAIAETVTTTAEDTTTTTSDTTTDSASSATASSVATTTDTSSNGS